MPDLTDTDQSFNNIASTVDEWFQTLPTTELQQMPRFELVCDLQRLHAAKLRAVYAEVRSEVAEEIAQAIEAQDGGDQGLPSGRDGRAFYASVARQHAERNTDA